MPKATLFTDARIIGGPLHADSLRVAGDKIAWAGNAASMPGRCVDPTVVLDGAWITPGFVDAHVHLTMTGMMQGGIDLHGTRNRTTMQQALRRYVAAHDSRFVWGYGWDDAAWATGPSGSLIEEVAPGRYVYLARVDGHSALVSKALVNAAECAGLEGADVENQIVRRQAHHAVRLFFLSRLPTPDLRSAQSRAADMAVAKGITTVHEMSGPVHAAGERDLDLVLQDRLPVSVICYYATDDMQVALSRGLHQIGGDYNADGALGSRTAALTAPYADAEGHTGFLYQSGNDLGRFFTAATKAGLQAGVHCIGDAGCEAAVEGLEIAGRRAGRRAVAALRHRLEHFEMASPALITRAHVAGAVFSMQPAFDAHWGGKGRMYEARAGSRRARTMNNLAAIAASGAIMGFGSDSPVTPFDPLRGIQAATHPSNSKHAVSVDDAFVAATHGAHALARQEHIAGRIEAGMRADFVVWDANPLQSKRARILATVSRGKVVYGSLPEPAATPGRRRSQTPRHARA